jgi:2'-5' RNA ligase
MGKIAIDIVLLPSDEMMDHVIRANRDLIDNHGDTGIVLIKKHCVPHISLCMGVIEEDKLNEVNEIIQKLAESYSPFSFNANTLTNSEDPEKDNYLSLNFEYSHRFRDFQQEVMKLLREMVNYEDATAEMLVDPPHDKILSLKDYGEKDGHPNLYNPHITVGFGKTDVLDLPIRFSSSKLAIFQLGDNYACKKLLGVYDLIGE